MILMRMVAKWMETRTRRYEIHLSHCLKWIYWNTKGKMHSVISLWPTSPVVPVQISIKATKSCCPAEAKRYYDYNTSIFHMVSKGGYAQWLTTSRWKDTMMWYKYTSPYILPTIVSRWSLMSPELSAVVCIARQTSIVWKINQLVLN